MLRFEILTLFPEVFTSFLEASLIKKGIERKQLNIDLVNFRKNGIESSIVKKWLALLGWETLIHRRSTSWKSLAENVKIGMDDDKAISVILKKPTLIKRPVAEFGEIVLIGFKPMIYEEHFSNFEQRKNYE